jgi:hypothetical protein
MHFMKLEEDIEFIVSSCPQSNDNECDVVYIATHGRCLSKHVTQ